MDGLLGIAHTQQLNIVHSSLTSLEKPDKDSDGSNTGGYEQ